MEIIFTNKNIVLKTNLSNKNTMLKVKLIMK